MHLAAMADVGAAERDPERAWAVNVGGTSEIVRQCREHDARLVFMSTEYVFDGASGPYDEDDSPAPTTQYGRTKLDAEREVASLGDRGSIVRTSIVYGWPLQRHRNFVPMLIERLRSGQPYPASTSVMRSPVYVEHLADGVAGLVEQRLPGVHHIAGRDWVSMYDFALAVADAFELDRELVRPGTGASGEIGGADRLGLNSCRTMQQSGTGATGAGRGTGGYAGRVVWPQSGNSRKLAGCNEDDSCDSRSPGTATSTRLLRTQSAAHQLFAEVPCPSRE